MKKRKRIFQTPEERAAWVARGEEIQRGLQYWIERGKAERAARQKPT